MQMNKRNRDWEEAKFFIFYEDIDPHGGCVTRGVLGNLEGYADFACANADVHEHTAVLLREDRMVNNTWEPCDLHKTGGLWHIKIGNHNFSTEFWVRKSEPKWDGTVAQLASIGVEVVENVHREARKLPAGITAESVHTARPPSGWKPGRPEVRPVPATGSPPVAKPPAAARVTWQEQLSATDWGRVPGLASSLPPMPLGGVNSPCNEKVLTAFGLTPLSEVRCVLIAKYPYPKPELATGLALSPGVPKYPFHDNVLFKALVNDRELGFAGRLPPAADLTRWATHAGVLLLNASLQGDKEKPERVWLPFLTKVIGAVCAQAEAAKTPVGFLFIGAEAKKLTKAVRGASARCVVECNYPAMQHAAPFVADPPFGKVNGLLTANGAPRVEWEALLAPALRVD